MPDGTTRDNATVADRPTVEEIEARRQARAGGGVEHARNQPVPGRPAPPAPRHDEH